VKGKGGKIACIPYCEVILSEWSLSPHGSKVALVETSQESSELKILEDRVLGTLPVQWVEMKIVDRCLLDFRWKTLVYDHRF
jgi:hypothetical protein